MPNRRAVLDTNFLYYLAGVATDARLRTDWPVVLEGTHELSLASPTVVELLTNQDLEDAELWACLDMMFSGRFGDIIQIGYMPFDVRALEEVVSTQDNEALRDIRIRALHQKIGCEVEFLRFVLMVLLGGFLHALFEKRREALSEEQQECLLRHFDALMKSNLEFVAASLSDAVVDGYAAGDVKKVVERAFHGLLWSFVYISLTNLHGILHGLQIGDVLNAPTDAQRQIREAVLSDPILQLLAKNQGNPIGLLRKKQFREAVNEYFGKMETDFIEHSTMPPQVLRYFVDRLLRDVTSGTKFRKNDVIDLLLAYSIIVADTEFVTNDDGVLDAIKTASPNSHRLVMALRR